MECEPLCTLQPQKGNVIQILISKVSHALNWAKLDVESVRIPFLDVDQEENFFWTGLIVTTRLQHTPNLSNFQHQKWGEPDVWTRILLCVYGKRTGFFSTQKLRVCVLCECVLYMGDYGKLFDPSLNKLGVPTRSL